MKRLILAVGVLVSAATPAVAHDSWLIADRQTVQDGDPVWLSFVTGEVFPFGDSITDAERVASFVDCRGERRTTITGLAPQDKGLSVRGPIAGAGIHVIGLALRPRLIDLPAADFESYLRSERAVRAIAEWAGRSTRPDGETERYTKYGKTIIQVGPVVDDDDGYLTPVGHRLEIIPLSNPSAWKSGTQVRVRVLLDGYPWPDIALSAGHTGLGQHKYAVETVTGLDGVATISLDRPGHWFLKAHLIRSTRSIGNVGWESFWASLSFRVTGAADVGGMTQAIRGIHGELRPGAVAGYRIGSRALDMLRLPRGSAAVDVTVHAPRLVRYACIADGIQAATGASLGKLNLTLLDCEASELVVVIRNNDSNVAVQARLTDSFLRALGEPTRSAEAAALKAATMDDAELFSITMTDSGDRAALPIRPEPPAHAGLNRASASNRAKFRANK